MTFWLDAFNLAL
jgi:hypothetical protein